MKKIILLLTALTFITFKNQSQTIVDIDDNVYNTITIGTQIWMKENLKTTKYNDNTEISLVTNNTTWAASTTPAYCWYDNDSATYKNTYGALYNWYAVNTGKLCPTGWHVPSDAEWKILTDYLGGLSVAGGKMKETDTTHWNNPNTGATNESGFTGLPSGDRFSGYSGIRDFGGWWSGTEYTDTTYARDRNLMHSLSAVGDAHDPKYVGLSVRCVNDSTSGISNINQHEYFKIYPNPAIDKIYIDCTEKQDFKMQVYNMIGVGVLQKELTNGTNDIDIKSLSKGIYVIKLTGTDWTAERKLIRE